ncbi:haloacid dehalogenase-like hydrolase [Pseudomonas sp. PCH446]
MTISNSAAPQAGTCVAFDFDGTITTTDSLRDFVRYQVGNRRFLIGGLLVLPWLVGMYTGLCKRAEAKARFLALTLRGRTQVELEEAAARYVTERLPTLIRPEMLDRIEEHKRLGIAWYWSVLHPRSTSGTGPGQRFCGGTGHATGVSRRSVYRTLGITQLLGPEKVRQLQQWLGGTGGRVLFAYGDSRGDQEMLAFAEHGWLRGLGALPSLDAWPDGLHHG